MGATMLNGAAVMDAALLLIAGNEPCPQPQTSEHLAAVEIMKLQHIIILQNKIDLVKEAAALQRHEDIRAFVKGTVADNAPIVPISAQLGYNIDVVAEYITNSIPVPVRDFTGEPKMIVIRSFDVNKPGQEADDLHGGVAGGSILQGVLKAGHEVEIRPGIISRNANGTVKCVPLFSRIVGLKAEQNELQYAAPGGLIGVGTLIDLLAKCLVQLATCRRSTRRSRSAITCSDDFWESRRLRERSKARCRNLPRLRF